MVDGDISCPSVGNSDGRPWGDQMTVPGEFCWPPMGSFAWPPSNAGRSSNTKSPHEDRVRVNACIGQRRQRASRSREDRVNLAFGVGSKTREDALWSFETRLQIQATRRGRSPRPPGRGGGVAAVRGEGRLEAVKRRSQPVAATAWLKT